MFSAYIILISAQKHHTKKQDYHPLTYINTQPQTRPDQPDRGPQLRPTPALTQSAFGEIMERYYEKAQEREAKQARIWRDNLVIESKVLPTEFLIP